MGLLFALLARQDWSQLASHLGALQGSTLLAAVAFIALTHAANTARWLTLVRAQGIRLSYLDAYRLVLAGLFASNFLPSTVGGDVTRIAGILPRSEDKLAGAASVVADRLISLVGMCFLIPFSLPILGAWASAGVPLGLSVSGASGTPIEGRVRHFLARAGGVVGLWQRKPAMVGAALGFSWLGVGSYLLALWELAKGLGMSVTLVQVAGATTITYFLTLIPIAINGYGIREAAILAVYLPLGASPEQATALALASRALMVIVTLPGAFWLGRIPADSLCLVRRSDGGSR
jgi:uncharacterized membrane protein YbhN (UPF0104 family)